MNVLKSHFVNERAYQYILENNFEKFMVEREHIIISKIRQLIGAKSIIEVQFDNSVKSPINKFENKLRLFINEEMNKRIKEYGALAGALHTDMHEVIGHASGQINPGIGDPSETLKNYANTLEEGRADLVALYYVLDKKLIPY